MTVAGSPSKKAPKYQKIKEYVLQGIASRNFTDGVPSENQLADKFSVSRMTARRALADLEREGSVERIPGKGTFVRRSGHYTQGFFRVRPFRKWAEDLGAELRTEVLASQIVDPPEKIAEILDYQGQMIRLRILNYLNDVPVRYAVRYLRADQCADILWENLAENSIHDILINKYRLPLTRIRQSMTAVGLPEDLAGLFREAPGFPVFHFQRTAYSCDTAVTYVEYYMRGDMAFKDTFTPTLEPADFRA
jgi:GntR family transcriptional regulator